MTEKQMEEFAVILARTLQQSRSVSDSEHYDHHRWISQRIKQAEVRVKFWEDMRTHAAKWGMISVLSSVLYALWLGVKILSGQPPK